MGGHCVGGAEVLQMWLEPLKLNSTQTAAHLKVARKTLSELLNGHTHLRAAMALRLELAFGKSAESWLAHQAAFVLWQRQESKNTLEIQALALS